MYDTECVLVVNACVWSEVLLQPQCRVEEAVSLRVHSGQSMSIFWKPQQSGGTDGTIGGAVNRLVDRLSRR